MNHTVQMDMLVNLTSTLPHSNSTLNVVEDIILENIALKVVAATVCLFILFFGIVGNSLVLIVFGHRISRLKSFEIYLLSLAAADLIASVMIPSKMLYELLGGSFHSIGTKGCTVIACLCTSSITISCLTLVVISLNRYVVVRWPLSERRSNLTLLLVIVGTWLIGMTMAAAIYIVDGRITMAIVGDVEVCSMNFRSYTEFKIYGAILFISQSGIPLLSMCVLYGLIIYELSKNTKIEIFQNRENVLNTIYQRNKKSIRLLIALLIVFIICTTPEKLYYMIYTFKLQSFDPDLFYILYTLLTLLLMVNHCVNPIVYAKLHTSFRRHTLRMFCTCKLFTWNLNESTLPVFTKNRQHSILTSNVSISSKLSLHCPQNSQSSNNSVLLRQQRRGSAPASILIQHSEMLILERVGSHPRELSTLLEDDGSNMQTNV